MSTESRRWNEEARSKNVVRRERKKKKETQRLMWEGRGVNKKKIEEGKNLQQREEWEDRFKKGRRKVGRLND